MGVLCALRLDGDGTKEELLAGALMFSSQLAELALNHTNYGTNFTSDTD